MTFRFEPISKAAYTEKLGGIAAKTVGDLSSIAAQTYEGWKQKANDQDFKSTLFAEVEKKYGDDPILSKQIAANKDKVMAMPRAEAEAAIASYAIQAETFKSTKELYPNAKLTAPVGFIPDAQVGYYNLLKGAVGKYSSDAEAARKTASRTAVSEGLKDYNPATQSQQALGRSLALNPIVDIEDAETAMKFGELPPEKDKKSDTKAKIAADKESEKMKEFENLRSEAASIRSQMTNVEAAQNRIQKKGASIESILADPNSAPEDKADAILVRDSKESRDRLEMLKAVLMRADADERRKPASYYLNNYRTLAYNREQAKKEYDAKNGQGSFEKLPDEEKYKRAQNYSSPVQNPIASTAKKKYTIRSIKSAPKAVEAIAESD